MRRHLLGLLAVVALAATARAQELGIAPQTGGALSARVISSAWESGSCVGFASADAVADCADLGAEVRFGEALTLSTVSVVHVGPPLPAGNVCNVDVLVRSAADMDAGALVGTVVYGDAASNEAGETATPVSLGDAAVEAGGAVQLRFAANGSVCTEINAAVVLEVN